MRVTPISAVWRYIAVIMVVGVGMVVKTDPNVYMRPKV
jgi:hypothetical protein